MNSFDSEHSELSNENQSYGIIPYQTYFLKHWDCFHSFKPDIYVEQCRFCSNYWLTQVYVRNYGSQSFVISQWCSTCTKWTKNIWHPFSDFAQWWSHMSV